MRHTVKWVALSALLAGLTAGGLLFATHHQTYAFNGSELRPATAAPPLPLTDDRGHPFDLGAAKGDVVLLYFGYTNCPDVCPATLSDLKVVRAKLGAQAARVKVVFVTIDPARDTGPRLVRYLAEFDPTFVGLTGRPAELAAVERAYGVSAVMKPATAPAMGYQMAHSATVYVIDPQGRWRLIYTQATQPSAIAADVRHLLSPD